MREIRWHAPRRPGREDGVAALRDARDARRRSVQAFPEYGPERRGAPMRAYTRIDDRPIRRHDAITRPDAVVVLEPSLVREVDVTEGLAPGRAAARQLEVAPAARGPDVCVRVAALARRCT